jgi:PAS domain S-box-containing protein
MDDVKKTKAQLIDELKILRQRVECMERSIIQQSSASIEEDRDKLSALVNSISDEVWFADTQNRFTLANPSSLREFGLDIEDGIDVEKLAESLEVYRSDGTKRPVEESPPLRALKGESVRNEEEIVRTPRSGELRFRQVSSTPVKDASGNIIGAVSVVRDITESKRTEEALCEDEERLRYALETSHTGAWDLNLVDHTAFRSLEHDRIFGYTEQLPQWTYEMFLEHVLPEDRTEVDTKFRHAAAAQSDWSFECRIRRTDGEIRWIWAAGRHCADTAGGLRRMTGIVQDITEHKRAEEELRQNESTLRGILDASKESIWLFSPEGIILLANQTASQRLEKQLEDIIGKHIDNYLPHDIALAMMKMLRLAVSSGRPVEYEDTQNGIRFYHNFYPVFDLNGRVVRVATFSRDITERKQAEEELRVSRRQAEFLGNILEHSSQPFGVGYPDGRLGLVNSAFEQLTGYTGEELRLMDWAATLTPPEWRQLEHEKLDELLHTGQPVRYEKEYIRRDGSRVPIELLVHLKTDSTGNPEYFYSFLTDITKRKQIESELKRMASLLKETQYLARVGGWELNVVENTLYWTDETYRIHETSPAEYTPTVETAIAFYAPASVPIIKAAVQEAIEKGKEFSLKLELITAKGRFIWVEAAGSIMLENGRIVRIFGAFQDITERKLAEDALLESEERFRTMANSLPQLAWIAKPDGYIFWYNDRWYDYTGTTPQQMEGWGWQRVHDPLVLPKVLEQWKVSIDTGNPFDMEFPLLGADGRFRRFLTRVVPMKNSEGCVALWFGTNTDITEIIEADEKRKEAYKELQGFTYTVSHDLRAPLRHLASFAEMLKKRLGDQLDEKALHYMDVISGEAKRMGVLVDDLLEFTSMKRIDIQRVKVNLNALIVEAIQDLRDEVKEREIRWELDEMPEVYGDQSMLKLALVNLISNAVKFTQTRRPAEIKIECKEDRDKVICSIKDNGVGFDMKYVDKLFNVFQRLHHRDEFEGTGIGLANVRRIISRHGGSTWAEGAMGQGATFYFTLPKHKET